MRGPKYKAVSREERLPSSDLTKPDRYRTQWHVLSVTGHTYVASTSSEANARRIAHLLNEDESKKELPRA